MKTVLFAASVIILFVTLTPSAFGQTPPDVDFNSADINFEPSGPVPPGTPVTIFGQATNTGQTGTMCDIYFGLFDGFVFTDIDLLSGVSFPAATTTFFDAPWDTTGLSPTNQPVIVDIFNCSPTDPNLTNNQAQKDFDLPVELATFVATAGEDGVRLNWTTESEVANLGFNIFRSASPEGTFTRINTKLIKGAGTTPYRHEYSYFDKGASGENNFYYIQDISLGGTTGDSWVAEVTSAGESAIPTVSKKTATENRGLHVKPMQAKIPPSDRFFSSAKILVDKSAIIKVTYSDLQRAGIDPGLIDLNRLRISNKGVSTAVQLQDGNDGSFDPGDYLQFKGSFNRGTHTYENDLSRVNVYWISWDDRTPSPQIEGFAVDAVEGPFPTTLHFEKNLTYSRLGNVTDVARDRWFWAQIDSSESRSFKIDVQDVVSGTASLQVMLHGNTHLPTNPDHTAGIFLNGVSLGNVQWDGQKPYLFEMEFKSSYLLEGENTLTVEATNTGVDSFFMNWAELNYARATPVVTEVHSPMDILGYKSAQLKSPENAAEYIVITHPNFMENAITLAEHREAKGMKTKVVDITDIYDEFSHGITDYAAIRSFLQYAYENWQKPTISYAVLFGDAYEDPKNNLGLGFTNFIPAYPYVTPDYAYENEEESFGLSYSDHWFGALSGDDAIPEVSIGRLPVTNLEEAEIVVQKIITYETNSDSAAWKEKMLFINGGYDPQEESLLNNTTEKLITHQKLSERAHKMYMTPIRKDSLQYADGKIDIVSQFNQGVGLVNYLGHAGADSWDVLFQDSDVALLDNYYRLPFVMSLTCWTGTFTGERESLGESLLKGANGGAIAFLGSTSAGLLAGNSLLDIELFEQILQTEGPMTLGKIVDRAKTRLIQKYPAYIDFVQTYTLLGDPALELKLERASPVK